MALAAGEKLYLNEDQKDVVFHVGPDEQNRVRFPAHKLILSSFSPVFANMLSERFHEGIAGEVTIPDVTPAAFRNVLQFAYTGTIKALSIATCKEILYAAQKYLLADLSKVCFAHLEKFEVNFENFWDFFNIIFTFHSEITSPKIVINTLQFLDVNAEKILSSDEFNNVDSEVVSIITARNSLKNISETVILQHVFQWSKFQCCRQNLEITEENQRNVLEKIKYDIRFLLIPRNEMLSGVIIQTILTENEKKILIEGSLRANGTLPLPWNLYLLSVPRGNSSTIQFKFDSGDNIVSPTNIFAIDLFLMVSNDCVFESLEINCLPQNSVVKITGDITDLNGYIYGTWVVQKTGVNVRGEVVTIGKPICLRGLKSYKLSLVCVTGHFEKKYDSTSFKYNRAVKTYLLSGNLPTDAVSLNILKSWENIELNPSTRKNFFKSNRNNFVKSVHIII